MSAGNWIKIEAQSSRTAGDVRSVISQFIASSGSLNSLVGKLAQMSAAGTDYADMEAELGLQPGEGAEVESLMASANTELVNAPFYQQMLTRLS